jgi:hypothetical protein
MSERKKIVLSQLQYDIAKKEATLMGLGLSEYIIAFGAPKLTEEQQLYEESLKELNKEFPGSKDW